MAKQDQGEHQHPKGATARHNDSALFGMFMRRRQPRAESMRPRGYDGSPKRKPPWSRTKDPKSEVTQKVGAGAVDPRPHGQWLDDNDPYPEGVPSSRKARSAAPSGPQTATRPPLARTASPVIRAYRAMPTRARPIARTTDAARGFPTKPPGDPVCQEDHECWRERGREAQPSIVRLVPAIAAAAITVSISATKAKARGCPDSTSSTAAKAPTPHTAVRATETFVPSRP